MALANVRIGKGRIDPQQLPAQIVSGTVSISNTRQWSSRLLRACAHQHRYRHHQPGFIRQRQVPIRADSRVRHTWPAPRGRKDDLGPPGKRSGTTPTSRIHMPLAKPVPIALTTASFAANRMARKRCRTLAAAESSSSSSGISRRLDETLAKTGIDPMRRDRRAGCRHRFRKSSRPRAPRPSARFHFVQQPLPGPSDDRPRDDGMTDIQFDNLRRNAPPSAATLCIVQAVAGVDLQTRFHPHRHNERQASWMRASSSRPACSESAASA